MKTILGIDTSTLTASVAVVRGTPGEAAVLGAGASRVNTHSERLLWLIDEALSAAAIGLDELDGIAVGAGPGSFTGLRIGMATAKGLGFATGKPLWAVSSLAALALALTDTEDVDRTTLVVPVLDARRSEIFAGFYRVGAGEAEAVAPERVMAPGELGGALARALAGSGCERAVALGDGLPAYSELADVLAGVARLADAAASIPPAAAVARLALAGEHPDVLTHGAPAYVRLSEAELMLSSK